KPFRSAAWTRCGELSELQNAAALANSLRAKHRQLLAALVDEHQGSVRERLDRLRAYLIAAGLGIGRRRVQLVAIHLDRGLDDPPAAIQVDVADHGAVAMEVEGGAVLFASLDHPFADEIARQLVEHYELGKSPGRAAHEQECDRHQEDAFAV